MLKWCNRFLILILTLLCFQTYITLVGGVQGFSGPNCKSIRIKPCVPLYKKKIIKKKIWFWSINVHHYVRASCVWRVVRMNVHIYLLVCASVTLIVDRKFLSNATNASFAEVQGIDYRQTAKPPYCMWLYWHWSGPVTLYKVHKWTFNKKVWVPLLYSISSQRGKRPSINLSFLLEIQLEVSIERIFLLPFASKFNVILYAMRCLRIIQFHMNILVFK